MNPLLESFLYNNFGWIGYFWPFGWRNAVLTALSMGVGLVIAETVEFLIDWRSRRRGK